MADEITVSGLTKIESYLVSRPDPVLVVTDLIPRLTAAIELTKTPPEANDIRTMFDMTMRYLRQQLPGVVKDRWERYKLMHPAETGYVETAAKAGILWEAIDEKTKPGGDRPSKNDSNFDSAKSPNGKSAIEEGFKGARDATRCERAGKLHPEDRRIYYEEMYLDQRHVTLDGAERIWLMMQEDTWQMN